ncbi:glycosyltransferase [Cellulomonas sp. PS-H5]|uniref:glycosyltransferase n=1 Tax=Cellulomonas sp. PS-H5 TaxID=2820400 RepID=UPI001C4FE806|nr:glycosyltransferase [Cellulomonas sp. PS-H5]MBW0254619.1 glycosyltransferase [Cellulomonas sp. PS-H5]
MHLLIVTTSGTAGAARLTAGSAVAVGAEVQVLDLDAGYVPAAGERVLSPADAGVDPAQLHRWAARHPLDVVRSLAARRLLAARAAAGAHAAVVLAAPGVLLLAPPDALASAADRHGLALVVRPVPPADGRRPDAGDLGRAGAVEPALLAVRPDRADVLAAWEEVLAGVGPRDDGQHAWPGVLTALPHAADRAAGTLVSPWSLRREHHLAEDPRRGLLLDGTPVVAVDLTATDPARPWLLDGGIAGDPRARLSDHPALATRVADAAAVLAAATAAPDPGADLARTSVGARLDPAFRTLYREQGSAVTAPDPFDPARRQELLDWLTQPSGSGAPGRYLLAIRAARPDLAAAFPWVPGRDEEAFVGWAADHAASEGYDAALVEESVRRWTPPPPPPATFGPGVNVVGFLRGELGIGESARQVVGALAAAGVPHVAVPVETHLSSRQRPAGPATGPVRAPLATTVLCVNADLTPTVAAGLPVAYDRTYRIGMWYWEVEDFPASQHGGFAAVEEVWVATDFIRDAIAPHTALPVTTLTPPLPQRPAAPALGRADLGLPEGPLFLFAFDFLSTAERKNPLGLVDAFCAAFGPEDGPVLVVKSINADQRPADAERLRLRVAGLPHVLLLEEYLDADARDALMAACDCYVSLHRSEGLGLTMAEAMAWGKPVIATRYSGNLQFMTDANSYLVDWTPVPIPDDAAPYPAGSTWAEPDLDHAARLMREVVAHPEQARARGERAAGDIATLHSPAAAGRRVAARLAEIAQDRPEAAQASPGRRLLGRLRGAARG